MCAKLKLSVQSHIPTFFYALLKAKVFENGKAIFLQKNHTNNKYSCPSIDE
jgi:hypothetical protein